MSPHKWKKLGHVFVADKRFWWMQEYAQVPTPILLEERIRIFFTCRPEREESGDYISFTTYLDVDRNDPTRILHVNDRPCMEPGALGSFDQFGVMPCSVIRREDELWLYYVGWARTRGVPWQSAIGLAISRDEGKSFTRYGGGPIMSRTPSEPYVHGSPFVMHIEDQFHMWYLTGAHWAESEGRMESIYRLKHAVSLNGIDWRRDDGYCLPVNSENECQARPAVMRTDSGFSMWFSYRHGVDFRNPDKGYRIGFASSPDGANWFRTDDVGGLERSPSGWDSEMVSYPSLLTVDGRVLMFYCGNQMGLAGFGVAELVG